MKNIKSGKVMLALCTSTLAVSLLSGFIGPAAHAAKSEAGSSTKLREGFNAPLILSGLKNLKVSVGELDSYLVEQGLSKASLEECLTEGLSPTHITICGAEDCCAKKSGKECNPDNTAILYLKIKSDPDNKSSKSAACAVSLSLVEKAKLARSKKDLMVAVWSAQSVASAQDNVKDEVKDEVKSLIGEFLKDFRLANSADLNHIDIPVPGESKEPGFKVK